MKSEMTQRLELRLKELKGIDSEMIGSLRGKLVYVHEGNTNIPFSGTLDEYGEQFLKFTGVTTYTNHFSLKHIGDMREALESGRCVSGKIPTVYKNKGDVATLVELYPEE